MEPCIEENYEIYYRVGTDPLPSCIPNWNTNELICNGGFEQYDPILNNPPTNAGSSSPLWSNGISSDIVNWKSNLTSSPDVFVRNGITGIPTPTNYTFTQQSVNTWDWPRLNNNLMVGMLSIYFDMMGTTIDYGEGIVSDLLYPLNPSSTYTFRAKCNTGGRHNPPTTVVDSTHELRILFKSSSNSGLTYLAASQILTNRNNLTNSDGWESIVITFSTPASANMPVGVYDIIEIEVGSLGVTNSNQEVYTFIDEISLLLDTNCSVFPQQIALLNTNGTLPAGIHISNAGDTITTNTSLSYTLQNHHHAHRFIETDTAGNTYLAARVVYDGNGMWLTSYNATIGYGTNPTLNQTIDGPTAILVAKYDECGDLLWKEHIYNDEIVDVAALQVSQAGEIYIGGNYTNQLASNNVRTSSGCAAPQQANRSGNFIVKFNTSGQCQWLKNSSANSPNALPITDMELNDVGTNLYVSGLNAGSSSANFLSNLTTPNEYFIAEITGLNTINPATSQFTKGSNRTLDRIALSGNDLFVTFFENASGNTPQIVFRKYNVSNLNAGFTASASPIVDDASNSNACWNFPNSVIEDLEVDSQGNLFVTGNFSGSLSFNGTASSTTSATVMAQDYTSVGIGVTGFVAKYNNNLAFQQYDYLKPSITHNTFVNAAIYNSHYYTCNPSASCDYVVSFLSTQCPSGIMYNCVDFDTVALLATNAYTENTWFSSLYQDIAFDENDNLLISGIVQNAMWEHTNR